MKCLRAVTALLSVALAVGICFSGSLCDGGDETVGELLIGSSRLSLEDDYLSGETLMGDFAADALRYACKTDIAVLGAGCLKQPLTDGTATNEQIQAMFRQDAPIYTAAISAASLKAYLEAGVSHIVLGEDERIDVQASAYDGFPAVSGMCFCYDASAPAGNRVYEITVQGTVVNMTDTDPAFTVAAPEGSLNGALGLPVLDDSYAGRTLTEAVNAYVANGVTECTSGRIYVRGVSDNWITGDLPIGMIALLLVLLCLLVYVLFRHSIALQRFKELYGRPKTR